MNIEVTKLSDLDRLRDDELVAFLRGREVNTISSEGNRRRLLNLAKFYFRFFATFFSPSSTLSNDFKKNSVLSFESSVFWF